MRDIIRANTCTAAWLEAMNHLNSLAGKHDFNLILEIANPMKVLGSEAKVKMELDNFLKKNDKQTVGAVINTIFPASLYAKHGRAGLFKVYKDQVYPKLKAHPDTKWGTYFMRMIDRPGPKGESINLLDYLIGKIQSEIKTPGPKTALYEMNLIDVAAEIPIYNGTEDKHYHRGGPCLSHLSFKLDDEGRLLLTVMYRLHYYVQRTLGNLFGLALLQDFVAREAGIKTGSLVCISTKAVLESEKMSMTDIKKMLEKCNAFMK